MKLRLLLTIYILMLCALPHCASPNDPLPVGERAITEPHQEFGEATLFFYEGGVLRWRLDADHINRPLADMGDVNAAPVKISVYDTLGNLSTRIVADSGKNDAKTNVFDLWGDVQIINEDSMIVKSYQLKWHRAWRRVTSDTYVQIETPKGDILRGKGLDAQDDFSRFSFMADVEGRFPDFKRRIEEQGDDFFK